MLLHDPNITTKLDFSKPINFVVHGWTPGLGLNDEVSDEKVGM